MLKNKLSEEEKSPPVAGQFKFHERGIDRRLKCGVSRITRLLKGPCHEIKVIFVDI
jgi:hypothetical protein